MNNIINGSLNHIIYCSRAELPEDCDIQTELNKITEVAIKNNHKCQVTGYLVYYDGWFLQALEGDRKIIKALYDKISKDSRHSDIEIIDFSKISTRKFEQWNMSSIILSANDEMIRKHYASNRRFDPMAMSEQKALDFLVAASKINA